MGKIKKWQPVGFKSGVRYDAQDAAKILKISYQTIRRFIREGQIEAVRGGPPYFIRGETLKNFISLLRPVGRPKTKNLSQEGGRIQC